MESSRAKGWQDIVVVIVTLVSLIFFMSLLLDFFKDVRMKNPVVERSDERGMTLCVFARESHDEVVKHRFDGVQAWKRRETPTTIRFHFTNVSNKETQIAEFSGRVRAVIIKEIHPDSVCS